LPLRILFAGTPEFALPALDALAASGNTLVGVLTQPDRPAGRTAGAGQSERRRALESSVPACSGHAGDEGIQPSSRQNRRILVVAAYGSVARALPARRGSLCEHHASLPPRLRGAALTQRDLAGDLETE
jgi:methionyl-tRNA formyltransferase